MLQDVEREKSKRGARKTVNIEELQQAVENRKFIVQQLIRDDSCARIVMSTPALVRNYYLHGLAGETLMARLEDSTSRLVHEVHTPQEAFEALKKKHRNLPLPRAFLDTQFEIGDFLLTSLEWENRSIVKEDGRHPVQIAGLMLHRSRGACEYKYFLNSLEDYITSVNRASNVDRFPLSITTDDDKAIRAAVRDVCFTRSTKHFLCVVHLRRTLEFNCDRFKVSPENTQILKNACFGRDQYGKDSVLEAMTESQFEDVFTSWIEKSDMPNFTVEFWKWLVKHLL